MSSELNIIRQVAWLALIPQFLFAMLLIFLWHLLRAPDPALYGLVSYFLISYGLRMFIPKLHNKGMKHVKKGEFAQAIPYFHQSYDFFEKNLWVDKYRFITVLSSSAMSYREMALTNIALAYTQLGELLKAKEFYEKTLVEFPKSVLAKDELALIKRELLNPTS